MMAHKELDYFLENLSMLAASGMAIDAALLASRAELTNRRARHVADTIQKEVEGGMALWQAFSKTGAFPAHIVSLVKLGEESGTLAENLKVIAREREKDRMFRSQVRSAMMYPVFVLSLTAVVGAGVAWVILPRLAAVFAQLRVGLPPITKALMAAGVFIGERGATALPLFFAVFFLCVYMVFYFPKTKHVGHALLFALPGVGQLMKETELARMGYLLGALIAAGVPMVQALRSLADAAFFPFYRRFFSYLSARIEEGDSFQQSFAAHRETARLMPVPVQQMIVAGERSGSLADAFSRIGGHFEARVALTTKNLATVLEPLLLVVVWVGVVAVALAIILPIYNLIGSLHQ